MSINFCYHGLVSSISSTTSSFDGYEVCNLIDKKLKKGYIADHFVKPPVSITLNFICEIDISHILLKTFVSSQRSVKFEISTENSVDKGKVCSTLDVVADYILFHKYGDEKFLNRNILPTNIPFHSPHRLKKVMKLIVTILKTSNSSVPCLGLLEVWGEPSTTVSRLTVNDIKEKWKSILSPKKNEVKMKRPMATSLEKKIVKADFIALDIPEEFLDPITCDIMLCPMILPCGKIVDQSTLDKYYLFEAEWGRIKSDPFTGVPFTDYRKPVLDQILKVKIDKFLVSNSELEIIKNMPRIIGKNPISSLPGISLQLQEERASSSTNCDNSNLISSTSKTQKIKGNLERSSKKVIKCSLDELISNSLEGLPSYLEVKVPKTLVEECCLCKSKAMLFKLPCLHLICRSCLVKMPNISGSCKTCGKQFDRNEPIRYHNI